MSKILKRTPWGAPQSTEIVSDAGIVWYSTASHGGYKVDSKLNREIPEVFRDAQGWYEEDCEWSIVWIFLSAHFNPGQFKAETFMQAQSTLTNWYPHKWQEYNGVAAAKSEHCWDCQKNTCHATADLYPKEIANTGYGNYRILTQELSAGQVETRVFCQGLVVEVATTGQLNHSLCVDRVMSGHYEKFGNPPAFPIIKVA